MNRFLKPLWILSAILFVIWFVLKFLLHKGGYVHAILLTGVALFVVQLVQDRRTRAHEFYSRR